MDRGRAETWENEDAWDAAPPPRAKPIVRRVPPRWDERDGALSATIGFWLVRVVKGPSAGWEWSAFSQGNPRAVRCTGFPDRASAQQDAETSLARLA